MMKFARTLLAGLLAAAPLVGCDDATAADRLEPEDVAGFYTLCSMIFTPSGIPPAVNVAAAAFELSRQGDLPRLALDPTRTFEFEYTPKGQFTDRELTGTYNLSRETVELRFLGAAADAQDLLLPDRLELEFQASPRELIVASSQEYSVQRSDYTRLAEVAEAGLAEQIPGRLSARFAAGTCN